MKLVQILGIEAVKLNRLANYILLGLLLLLYAGATWSGYYVFMRAGAGATTEMLFHSVLQVDNSFVGLFVALFVIINIGKEYADGTLRKNIIDGYKRQEFFAGKLAVLLLATIVIFLLGKIMMLIGGVIIDRFNEMLLLMTGSFVFKSFLDVVTTAVFTFFLVFVTRSIVLSIVLFFVWSIVEVLLSQLAMFLFKFENLGIYLPITSIKTALAHGTSADTQTIAIAGSYALLMIVVPYLLFLRRDIR